MPRMANDDIGTCPCATCQKPSPVRKVKNSKLMYYWCSPCKTKCQAQEYILDNATLNGKPPLEPEPEPSTEPAQPPNRAGSEVIEPVEKVPAKAPRTEPEPNRDEPPTPAKKPKEKKPRQGFWPRFNTLLDED